MAHETLASDSHLTAIPVQSARAPQDSAPRALAASKPPTQPVVVGAVAQGTDVLGSGTHRARDGMPSRARQRTPHASPHPRQAYIARTQNGIPPAQRTELAPNIQGPPWASMVAL